MDVAVDGGMSSLKQTDQRKNKFLKFIQLFIMDRDTLHRIVGRLPT